MVRVSCAVAKGSEIDAVDLDEHPQLAPVVKMLDRLAELLVDRPRTPMSEPSSKPLADLSALEPVATAIEDEGLRV